MKGAAGALIAGLAALCAGCEFYNAFEPVLEFAAIECRCSANDGGISAHSIGGNLRCGFSTVLQVQSDGTVVLTDTPLRMVKCKHEPR